MSSKFFFIFVIILLPLFFISCTSTEKNDESNQNNSEEFSLIEPDVFEDDKGNKLQPVVCSEVWAYLVDGKEHFLDPKMPITDIGYFAAEINTYGELVGVPKVSKLKDFSGRVHLVAVCNSTALTHFSLDPKGNIRNQIIDSLVKASEGYDGLQLDFEYVPKRDAEAFLSFIKELRQRLPDKMFTVALPARNKQIENDVYDYKNIAPYVDRIFVMAYDEHWSTSKPGPVASLDWCDSIATYGIETVGKEKIVMGLPFYGRTWGSESFNIAYYFSSMQKVLRENKVNNLTRKNGIPTFSYQAEVTVTGFYDDVHSLLIRINRYLANDVSAIGFWCLGQEDPRVWEYISIQ